MSGFARYVGVTKQAVDKWSKGQMSSKKISDAFNSVKKPKVPARLSGRFINIVRSYWGL
jgi:hypothetical protein